MEIMISTSTSVVRTTGITTGGMMICLVSHLHLSVNKFLILSMAAGLGLERWAKAQKHLGGKVKVRGRLYLLAFSRTTVNVLWLR